MKSVIKAKLTLKYVKWKELPLCKIYKKTAKNRHEKRKTLQNFGNFMRNSTKI